MDFKISLSIQARIVDVSNSSRNEKRNKKFASDRLHFCVRGVLAVVTESHAIIRRRYSKSFCGLLIYPRASQGGYPHPAAAQIRRSNDVRRSNALWS
jgi:hypothetical protein